MLYIILLLSEAAPDSVGHIQIVHRLPNVLLLQSDIVSLHAEETAALPQGLLGLELLSLGFFLHDFMKLRLLLWLWHWLLKLKDLLFVVKVLGHYGQILF